MIISAPTDYRVAAKKRLPPFLFHYIDGGAGAECTLRRNVADLESVALRQRVLKNMTELDLSAELLGEQLPLPIALAPVGLAGMFARRGEVQAARAAASKGLPFTLSTVSVCSIEEVASHISRPLWFQLYVFKDRGFMRHILERAKAAGVRTLVFTVDLAVTGVRYRDAHSGLSGPYAALRRALQIAAHPRWAWNVGIKGRPHDFGNLAPWRGQATTLDEYFGWLDDNFDPSIDWHDLQWLRSAWDGTIVLKGILDPADARDALAWGADGIVVSNHGGRQLDGVLSATRALPAIADAVDGKLTIFADSGIRSGLDVLRMLALGADGVLLGRAYAYALAADGEAGVRNLLEILEKEIRVAMVLSGAKTLREVGRELLADSVF